MLFAIYRKNENKNKEKGFRQVICLEPSLKSVRISELTSSFLKKS